MFLQPGLQQKNKQNTFEVFTCAKKKKKKLKQAKVPFLKVEKKSSWTWQVF